METKYIYAICRSYDPKPVMFSNERKITLGIESEELVVELFNLFKNKRNDYVARLQAVRRENGVIVGIITDHFKQKPIERTVPLDDLVKEQDLVGPLKID